MQRAVKMILDGDLPGLRELLGASPLLSSEPLRESLFVPTLLHWFYAGDTLLHLAAAAYRSEMVKLLLNRGASARVARSRRKAQPLHYAADGHEQSPFWSPERQVETLAILLEAGADLNAQDGNGATALHRAVRTRCAAAVHFLLAQGADPQLANQSGSSAFHLAVQNTGRGGSGSEKAILAQGEIIQAFLHCGCDPQVRNGLGKSVFESARSEWIRQTLVKS